MPLSQLESSRNTLPSNLQQVFIVNPDRVSNSVTSNMLKPIQVKMREFLSPNELLNVLPISSPACFLIDFVLPEIHGLHLMEQLRRNNCYQPCIFVSSRVEPELIVTAMNRGAFGFVKRPFQSMELIDTVQRALNHDQAISPYIRVATKYQNNRSKLTRREQDVLSLLEIGRTAREIGEQLQLSYRTVENHRMRIFRKLGIQLHAQLIQQVTALNLLRANGTIF